MKTICLYFEIHQNIHLKRYRFFDIGTDHYYYDDYENARSITETAEKSYIPALKTLISMAESNKRFFKCALSLSGCAIEHGGEHPLPPGAGKERFSAGRRGETGSLERGKSPRPLALWQAEKSERTLVFSAIGSRQSEIGQL